MSHGSYSGEPNIVWRARLFLFIGFALMAGGLAGSVVSLVYLLLIPGSKSSPDIFSRCWSSSTLFIILHMNPVSNITDMPTCPKTSPLCSPQSSSGWHSTHHPNTNTIFNSRSQYQDPCEIVFLATHIFSVVPSSLRAPCSLLYDVHYIIVYLTGWLTV